MIWPRYHVAEASFQWSLCSFLRCGSLHGHAGALWEGARVRFQPGLFIIPDGRVNPGTGFNPGIPERVETSPECGSFQQWAVLQGSFVGRFLYRGGA